MADQDFVHLHVHTEFSLLDGLSMIDKLVARAKELNMRALAITDHGTMFGVMDFYRACKGAGIKPIIGVEAYLAPRSMKDKDAQLDKRAYHLLLLAKDQIGYKNLLRIASDAQLEGYYYRPRVDLEYLEENHLAEGLVATSGCLAAQIPTAIMGGRDNDARDLMDRYLRLFGKDNFFLELQQHDIPELDTVNRWLVDIGKYDDVQFLATNDVHYVLEGDYTAHDTLLCIQTSSLKSDENRLKMSDNSYFLTAQDAMWKYFGHIRDGEPLKNTLKVAEMCDVNLDDKQYHLPIFSVPEGYDSTSYLRHLCEIGMEWRFGSHSNDPHLHERLDFELTVINNMGFNTYFLIVWDLCQYAKEADIWWNVRGSGAGSLAAYCLGITSIDPIQNNLIFERFLNPGRVSMPDIDMDFPDDRRGEMISYAARKYGEDKVAAIITFGTMGAKASVRDVGRALGVDLGVVNQAARLIPTEAKQKALMEYVEMNPELSDLYKSNSQIREIIDTAKELQGVSRHASTHAAGVIVADKPLVEYLPLHRITGTDPSGGALKAVTQFPMETCESIGLLKIDFLGLSTLTIMRKACELIERHRGVHYDMENIPYRHEQVKDDPEQTRMLNEAFKLIGDADTVGVFQVEGGGMQQMLREMRPTKFEHIIAAISLYRPGPMDYIPMYNARMHGKETTQYLHPKLEPILGETYGICISGDSLVFDALTGQRYRVDELQDKAGNFYIQGIDDNYKPALGRVSRWMNNGNKEVYRLLLRNGATIKATSDHKFLTEDGWKKLEELKSGDYVATPPHLLEPENVIQVEREKLRVLAYLIADGSLASFAAVDFVNKEDCLIEEYVRCLNAFENLDVVYINQIHDVTRVSTKNRGSKGTSNLLSWMRELGLKYPPHLRMFGGCRSQEKFIPEFVFRLSNQDIIYFLASLWDCDGYMDNVLCHYKTISEELAYDVQTLLLRVGIPSVIYRSNYESARGERKAYQVTVYDTARLAELLQPHLLTEKAKVICSRYSKTTINRKSFIAEVDSTVNLSRRAIMEKYGIDRQHFKASRLDSRISSRVVEGIAQTLQLPRTQTLINLLWEVIESIEYVGNEDVYDLTVEGLHNFVANNIIVHNCVYQEQIMQIASELFGYSLGEADLMRRAVSKKKEKDLLKHKEIFLKQGPANGVDEAAAEKIFADIEFFANYGFNKSHAADYAVICVQTAFLKRHYPEEYMTAMLTVQRDDSVKVGHFLEECRRLGITILPPDVNYSQLDFDIQLQPDGKRAIRFGLAAVKNAGVGALEHILEARKDGVFKDLQDFCRRVDLRVVQKRALESLAKVGALAAFGGRSQIVAALDRMVSYSTSHHKDREVGQMNMFGMATSGTGELLDNLPDAVEVSQRDMLKWEKELLGLYVTGRPVDKYKTDLANHNTSVVDQLREEPSLFAGKTIKVAGEVVSIRKILTKNNDIMAVVHVEDWHDTAGTLDVVLFPKTWGKFQDEVEEGKILLFIGKFDASRGDPQIICDKVVSDFTNFMPADDTAVPTHRKDTPDWAAESWSSPVSAVPEPPPPPWAVDPDYAPPDEPPAWLVDESSAPPDYDEETGEVPQPAPMMEPAAVNGVAPATQGAAAVPVPAVEPQFAAPELPFAVAEMGDADVWLLVHFERSEDADKDRRRLRQLHGILTSYPGKDRFSIVLHGGKKRATLEYPNHTTHYCPELLNELRTKVDERAIEVFHRPD